MPGLDGLDGRLPQRHGPARSGGLLLHVCLEVLPSALSGKEHAPLSLLQAKTSLFLSHTECVR